jgi:hypothetical protein
MRIVFLVLLAGASALFGFEEYWVRTHYIALGADISLSKGNMNGQKILTAGETAEAERTAVPEIGHFIVPNVELGANMNAHTVALSFGIWKPNMETEKYTSEESKERGWFWRVGAEYRYYFLFPEVFQIGLGINYSFTRISLPKAVESEDSTGTPTQGEAVFSGNGPAFVASARYYLNDNLALEAVLRARLISFGYVTTPESGFSNLDDSLWQFFGELGVRAVMQF